MKRKLVSTHWIPKSFRTELPDFLELVMPSEEHGMYSKRELYAELADADALLIIRGRCDRELLENAPRLKAVATSSVGFDHIDCGCAQGKGVAVINAPVTVRETTSELTIALMLAVMRCVPQFDAYSRRELRTLNREFGSPCTRAYGKTLGIVGFGGIGEAVARKAAALGMKTVYNNSSGARENAVGAEYLPLDELLRTADVVSLHMPLTAATRRMIGEREIGLMKPTAYLVNMARGQVICESALVDALKHGGIAGAALDVFESEPEISSELAGLNNVVLSPHAGTFDDETRAEMAGEAIRGVAEFLSGGSPENRVV